MITISPASFDALELERLKAFRPKVDAWLQQTAPGWSGRDPAERNGVLDDIFALGRRSGMEVETDYALLAWILVNSGRNPRAFAGQREVREVLDAPGSTPPCKVTRLYEIAFNAPAAPL